VFIVDSRGETLLNLDIEPAPYPLTDGTRHQVHFGVQTMWRTKPTRQHRIPDVKIVMTHAQYAQVYATLINL
jgi:hypothetical protein